MAINDPRDIPGLVAWYSAEAESGYATDAQMASWTDLSGHGNHATGNTTDTLSTAGKPVWNPTMGMGGGPCIRFGAQFGGGLGNTGAYFSLPNLMAGATSGEVMATVATNSASGTTEGDWIKAGSNTGSAGAYAYQNVIYSDFGSTGRKSTGTVVLDITQWRRVNIWSAAGDWAYYLDQTKQFSTTSNTVGWAATPLLGNSGTSGPSNLSASTFEGLIGCVILYNRKLTATERADLDTWLQAHPNGGTLGVQTPTGNLAGTAPAVTGSLSATATIPPVDGDLAGAAPAVTAALSASATILANLSGTAPRVTGSFGATVAGAVTGDLAGTAPVVSGDFAANVASTVAPITADVDTFNLDNGITLDGISYATVTYDPVVPPPHIVPAPVRIMAQQIGGTP